MNIENKIKGFIGDFRTLFSERCPDLYISYLYHEDEDLYEVWYNTREVEKLDNYNQLVGELIEEYFDKNDIYNVFIDYNYKLSKLNKRINISVDNGKTDILSFSDFNLENKNMESKSFNISFRANLSMAS